MECGSTYVGGLRPAITASQPWCSWFNFGDSQPFAFTPPAGYNPVGLKITQYQTKRLSSFTDHEVIYPSDELFICSGLSDVIIHSKNHISAFANYPTIAAISFLSEGYWYFEITLLSYKKADEEKQRPNLFAVGVIDKPFFVQSVEFKGIGDAPASWGLDNTGRIGTNGVWKQSYVVSAKETTIGCAIKVLNVEEGKEKNKRAVLEFYGPKSNIPLGKIEDVEFIEGLAPAVSLIRDVEIQLNFGELPFRCTVPPESKPLCLWFSNKYQK